ncbi:type I-G CRISPR-associated protein, Cas3-extension family [Kitasatospora cineracea]
MHQLELPALHADDPLGFLAALGILELTTATLTAKPRLHWNGPAGPAVLTTDQPLTLDTLTDLLTTHLPPKPTPTAGQPDDTTDTDAQDDEDTSAAGTRNESWDPFPHVPGLLTRTREDTTAPNEALRLRVDTAHHTLRELAQAERETANRQARWFASLTNVMCFEDHTPKIGKNDPEPAEGSKPTAVRRTPVTPLIAAAGQMTITGLAQRAVLGCHNDPRQIRSALDGWRRVPDYASANFDHRSLGDAHTNSEGKPYQRGAPGPTWLALHALATFRLTATDRTQAATSWDTTNRRGALRWPAWTPPLTSAAVTVLLEHPAVRATEPATNHNTAMLTDLGVTALYTAPRTGLKQSNGPLAASRHLWP